MTTIPAPYRLVDAHNQGWYQVAGPGIRFAADYGDTRNLDDRLTLADIDTTRGPWRPVEPITDADTATLVQVFRDCGRSTVTTIAAALEDVFHQIRESYGGLNNLDSYPHAMRTMTAGREGSWESEALKKVIWFGNGLNLVRGKRGENPTVEAMRRRGPNRRVNIAGRATLATMFHRWVTDPTRYTEVAETLAFEVSHYADSCLPGWAHVADRWLTPGALDQDNFRTCYCLFYSRSARFDPAVLA